MEETFSHNEHLKTLNEFKHDFGINVIGQFSRRKQAKKATTVIFKFPSSSANIHQVTRVPYQNRGRCKLCTIQKIDSCAFIRCDDCDLSLC